MDDEIEHESIGKKRSPFLSADDAAFYLGVSPRTLQRMRQMRSGPSFRRHSRTVLYHIDDLDSWSRTLLVGADVCVA